MSKSYQSFESFLKEHRLVKEKHLKYYVYWVEHFTKHCDNSLQKISRKSISTFISAISRWRNVNDWQIRQADDAITIFTRNYLKKVHGFDMVEQCRQHDVPVHPGQESWIKIVDNTRESIVRLQYSYRTEQTYIQWIRRFSEYLEFKAPIQVDSGDVRNYMTYLALERNVAPATQNQAFNAVIFLFKHVLFREVEDLKDTPRPKRNRNIPVVLSIDEVKAILKHISPEYHLIFKLLYATGLRITECLELRYGDLDFDKGIITVKSGKGNKDRTTLLPQNLKDVLIQQLLVVKEQYIKDINDGYGSIGLPNAIGRKYPNAHKELTWQWLFPGKNLSKDPRTKKEGRYHVLGATLQKSFKKAKDAAGIHKRASVHSLRHSFATNMIEKGYDIRMVQDILGHKSVETTMIYTHVVKNRYANVHNPSEDLD